MKKLEKINRILNVTRVVVLVFILSTCIVLCTMNVILRYVVRGVPSMRPFPWVNELMQMGAIWIGFLAAGLGVKESAHISLETFVAKYLPERISKVLKKIAQLVVLCTLLVLIVVGIIVTISQSKSYLQNLRISNAFFYASIPVGCFYLFYDYLLIFIFGKHPFSKGSKEESQLSNDAEEDSVSVSGTC